MIDISCTPGWIKTIGRQVCCMFSHPFLWWNLIYHHRQTYLLYMSYQHMYCPPPYYKHLPSNVADLFINVSLEIICKPGKMFLVYSSFYRTSVAELHGLWSQKRCFWKANTIATHLGESKECIYWDAFVKFNKMDGHWNVNFPLRNKYWFHRVNTTSVSSQEYIWSLPGNTSNSRKCLKALWFLAPQKPEMLDEDQTNLNIL